jgi:sortase A
VLWRRRFEWFLWSIGILLLASYAAIRFHRASQAHRDVASFESRIQTHIATPILTVTPPEVAVITPELVVTPSGPTPTLPGEGPADYSLWSPDRIRAYQQSLQQKSSEPVALLRIPKIGLEVAVRGGTDDVTLDRGLGWIAGTTRPGERGNVGIAGHRDGFFRGLKDIARRDSIELVTLSGSQTYRVEQIWIVNPQDVQVLDPTPGPALTLVSCYPFYFVGSAPKRYIVRAVLRDPERSTQKSYDPSSGTPN